MNDCNECWEYESDIIGLKPRAGSQGGSCGCKKGLFKSGYLYDECDKCHPTCDGCIGYGPDKCIECGENLELGCNGCECIDGFVWSYYA